MRRGAAAREVGVSVDDRTAEIERRAAFQRTLAASVDVALAEREAKGRELDDSPTCFGRLSRLVGSCAPRRAHRRLLDIDLPAVVERCPLAANQAQQSAEPKASRFGLFGRMSDGSAPPVAVKKLQRVSGVIESRISLYEQRAIDAKGEAQQHLNAGNRAAALRAMKRSKAAEKQVSALFSTSVAIENQSDMLETAGLQREVADALHAGVKGMRKTHKALRDVESVADQASDMRDVSADVQAAMAQLNEAYDDDVLDDDELLAELDGGSPAGQQTVSAPVAIPAGAPKCPVATELPIGAYPTAPTNAIGERREDEGVSMACPS